MTQKPFALNVIVSDKKKHHWADLLLDVALEEKVNAVCYITGI